MYCRAVYYLYRYHHKLHFDNCYIDQFIMEVDGKRMALHEDKESIFPLTWKEELTYIKPSKLCHMFTYLLDNSSVFNFGR